MDSIRDRVLLSDLMRHTTSAEGGEPMAFRQISPNAGGSIGRFRRQG